MPNESYSSRRHRTNQNDALGFILLLGDIFSGTIVLGLVLIGVATSLDPCHLVFEEFLPHPYFRSIETIVTSWIARFVLCALCSCEFMRFALIVEFVVAILSLVGVSLLNTLLKIAENHCIWVYIKLRIIVASVLQIVGRTMGTATLFAHISTIFLFWVGIRCWNNIPKFLAMFFILIGIICAISFTLVLISAGKARATARNLIFKHKAVNFSTRDNKIDKRYYLYCLWRSQIPVGLPCGSFFVIKKTFAMAYLRELVNNFTNAMLLIIP